MFVSIVHVFLELMKSLQFTPTDMTYVGAILLKRINYFFFSLLLICDVSRVTSFSGTGTIIDYRCEDREKNLAS
jgi:hypothetical protein